MIPMPPARRKPLRRGVTVYLWYGGVVSRATLLRRGIHALRDCWRVSIYSNGDVHYAQRRHLHLCPEDARNQL